MIDARQWFKAIGTIPDRDPDCVVQIWIEGNKAITHDCLGEYSEEKQRLVAMVYRHLAEKWTDSTMKFYDHRKLWS